jgi:tetratricopeptide (TPR) repeat protein
MKRMSSVAGVALLLVSLAASQFAAAAQASPPQDQGPGYTMTEYQDFLKCQNEQDPQQRAKTCEGFIAGHPSVSPKLMLPAIRILYNTYFQNLKNYAKAIEYCDKMIAAGNQIDAGTRVEALYIRTSAFLAVFNDRDTSQATKDMATQERDAAIEGLKAVAALPKPAAQTDAQWADAIKPLLLQFNFVAGFTSGYLKDFKTAADYYKAALALDPSQSLTIYRLGVAYLTMDPPQTLDGFWALARSIALKVQGDTQVKAYLRAQVVRYQQTVTCDSLTDAEVNEMIQLAANSPDRPATYTLPSAADLKQATDPGSNFIEALQASGDKGKITWLAVCGLEFPEVGGKVIEITGDGPFLLKVFYAPTPEAIEAGTTPNMDAKVDGPPEVKRIQPGDPVRFSGTLVSYDASPFMLHWEKAKVNPEDIPAENKQPGKGPAKKPPKKPGTN